MNFKNEKGSITIFVLVGLLFMSAFLIILYASNVNKSKIVDEQFDIINAIYLPTDSTEESYIDAYTALRKKNKQILTEYVEDSNTIELTKTFEDKVSNYRIYGTSEGVGDNVNMFDNNSITKFYDKNGNVTTKNTISRGIITNNIGYGSSSSILCDSNITKLTAGIYVLSTDVLIGGTNNHIKIGIWDINKTRYEQFYNLHVYNMVTDNENWHRVSTTITFTKDTEIYGFIFQNLSNDTNTLFKNIQLKKVSEEPIIPNKYEEYGYKITLNILNSRNIFVSNSISNFFGIGFTGTDTASKGISTTKESLYPTYILEDVIINKSGFWAHPNICNSNINKLEAGTYTLSAYEMANKETGNLSGKIGFYTDYSERYSPNYAEKFNLKNYKEWERINYTFTLTEDTEILGFLFQGNGETEDNYVESFSFKNIQLEKGNEPTTYQENNQYDIYISSPLMEGDYIDFKSSSVVRNDGTKEKIEIPQILTSEDYTKIEVITEVVPSKIEVEYVGYNLE